MSLSHTKNFLLIAHPDLKDPNFSHSVVFVVDHNKESSFGFIINRREEGITLYDVFENMDQKAQEIPVFYGGPVQPEAIFILHRRGDDPDAGQWVMDDIYMGSSIYLVERLLKSNEEIVFLHGYAGWGKRQLENEINAHSWIKVPALIEDIPFGNMTDSESIWRKAMGRKGGVYQYYSRFVKDPGLN